jgi:cell pole-organizing protein PopZ
VSGRIATWLAAAGCALALAGCGGGSEQTSSEPVIPARVADDLASQSEELADLLAEVRTCDAAHAADALSDSVERAAGQIPNSLETELRAVVAELVDTVNCPQPEEEEEGEENGKGKGKDKDKDEDESAPVTTTIPLETTTE